MRLVHYRPDADVRDINTRFHGNYHMLLSCFLLVEAPHLYRLGIFLSCFGESETSPKRNSCRYLWAYANTSPVICWWGWGHSHLYRRGIQRGRVKFGRFLSASKINPKSISKNCEPKNKKALIQELVSGI